MFVPTQMIENLENISIMCVYQEMSNLVSFFTSLLSTSQICILFDFREKHKNAKPGSTADVFLSDVSLPSPLAYEEDQTMQIRTPSHKLPLWCEYEWTGVNRDAWDYLPVRSVLHNSWWAGSQSIGGTQSSACWGYNGVIKAPCCTGEKTLLHSINQ